jgi:hypothetical protein
MEPTNKELAAIAAIVAHLETCAGVRIVQRSVVMFGRARLPFVEYSQTNSHAGPGAEIVSRRAYATGPLPADYRHRKADAWRLPDGRTFYVAGYLSPAEIAKLPAHVFDGPAHVRDANGTPIPNVLFAFDESRAPLPDTFPRVRNVRQEFAPGARSRAKTVYHEHSKRELCWCTEDCIPDDADGDCRGTGWYWWPCSPGCLPDGEPVGPFDTEAEALADARDGAE